MRVLKLMYVRAGRAHVCIHLHHLYSRTVHEVTNRDLLQWHVSPPVLHDERKEVGHRRGPQPAQRVVVEARVERDDVVQVLAGDGEAAVARGDP
jgi:hypothetical protein